MTTYSRAVDVKVSTAVNSIQYVPLTFGYKKRVTDMISTGRPAGCWFLCVVR
jgi:hypothetical protein